MENNKQLSFNYKQKVLDQKWEWVEVKPYTKHLEKFLGVLGGKQIYMKVPSTIDIRLHS
jgi:hypothetical protein